MPTRAEILQTLGLASNEQAILAIIWHALIAIVVVGLLLGWRPSKKADAKVLSTPLLSVSILAWIYKNPFNGFAFFLFAALRPDPEPGIIRVPGPEEGGGKGE